MIKQTIFILTALIIFSIPVFADEPSIKASSAILATANGEQILYDKNPSQRVNPAGLTKLMTALVAYEKYGTDEVITIPSNFKDYISAYEQTINLTEGERITTGALINAIITGSANDAAIILAIHCGETVEGFVNMMNSRADSLGLTDTHYNNPTGIQNAEQYTTASDLLILYKAMCAIPYLNKALEKSSVTIDATDKNPKRTLWTSNSLASKYYSTNYYYTYAKGGKATSSNTGTSLIAGSAKGSSKFICVVLDSVQENGTNHSFIDAKKLFEYGYNNYTQKTIVEQDTIVREIRVKNAKGTDRTLLHAGNTLKCFILNGDTIENVVGTKSIPDFLYAPVNKGDIAGTITYTYNGKNAGTLSLTVGNTLEVNPIKFAGNSILWFITLKPVAVILGIIISAFAIYLTVVFIIVYKEQKKSRKKRR